MDVFATLCTPYNLPTDNKRVGPCSELKTDKETRNQNSPPIRGLPTELSQPTGATIPDPVILTGNRTRIRVIFGVNTEHVFFIFNGLSSSSVRDEW